mgnify:CR=1 FL=1
MKQELPDNTIKKYNPDCDLIQSHACDGYCNHKMIEKTVNIGNKVVDDIVKFSKCFDYGISFIEKIERKREKGMSSIEKLYLRNKVFNREQLMQRRRSPQPQDVVMKEIDPVIENEKRDI